MRIRGCAVICSLVLLVQLSFPTLVWGRDDGVGDVGTSHQNTYIAMRAEILVINPELRADQLTEWAENRGGYMLERSFSRLVLKVPAVSMMNLREEINRRAEELLSFSMNTRSLISELDAVEAGIASREESLERILGYLGDSDVSGTLALEKELWSLTQQIELLKGRLRVLQNQSRYGRAEILLTSPAARIPQRRETQFDWINTLGLYSFIDEVGR